MSIVLVEGNQGAGKTLLAVRAAVVTARRRPAMRIFAPFLIDHPQAELVPFDFFMAPDSPPGFYVVDEAARGFDSRRSMSLPPSVMRKITEERKHGREVWYLSQDVGMIDTRIRAMADEVRRLRPRLVTHRRYDPHTDAVTRREHPRYILQERWRGKGAARMDPRRRYDRRRLPWMLLRRYAVLYDTSATVDLAGHLAAGKDFYRDNMPAVSLRAINGGHD